MPMTANGDIPAPPLEKNGGVFTYIVSITGNSKVRNPPFEFTY